jgi:hypothetical protein
MRITRQEMTELSKILSSLTRSSLRGGTGIFFQKTYFSQNYLKHIRIDSVFNADSKYDTGFEPNPRGKHHTSYFTVLLCTLTYFEVLRCTLKYFKIGMHQYQYYQYQYHLVLVGIGIGEYW